MVKKFFILIFISSSIMFASWKTWSDGMISYKTQSGGSYSGNSVSGMYGGSFSVRWKPLGTIHPVHIDPPKFNIGCGGIDISLGSISYLNFDKLVDKLKQIASSAPAFAFKMAIQTVSEQIGSIMQDLETIVNEINNFSLDSCKIASSMGKGVAGAFGLGGSSGRYADGSEMVTKYQRDKKSFLGDAWDDLKTTVGGNFKKIRMEKPYGEFWIIAGATVMNPAGVSGVLLNPYSNGTLNIKDYTTILRSLVGTVLMDRRTADGTDTIVLMEETIKPELFLKLYTEESQQKLTFANDFNFYGEACQVITQTTLAIFPDYSACDTNGKARVIPIYQDINIDPFYINISSKVANLANCLSNGTCSSGDTDIISNMPPAIRFWFNLQKIASGKINYDAIYITNIIAMENGFAMYDFYLTYADKYIADVINEQVIINKDYIKELKKLRKRIAKLKKDALEFKKDFYDRHKIDFNKFSSDMIKIRKELLNESLSN